MEKHRDWKKMCEMIPFFEAASYFIEKKSGSEGSSIGVYDKSGGSAIVAFLFSPDGQLEKMLPSDDGSWEGIF